jgi:putative nucleotidyltransferase with HDIG domain
MKGSMVKKFFITIGIVFIALAAMLAITFYSFYSSSVQRVQRISESSLKYESAQIENYINKGMDVLWVTADSVNYMIDNGVPNEEILKYLVTQTEHEQKDIDENFTGVYGYINGEYLDGVGWVPPEDYEPKEREWYTAAKAAEGRTVIVPPYLDAQTDTVMISVSKLLSDNESVVSLDIVLNEIQYITENISIDDMGYGFIVDSTGLVVAHFDEDEKGKIYPLNEEQDILMNGIFSNASGSFQMLLDGEKCTVFSESVMDEWYVVMIVSNTRLFEEVRKQMFSNIVVCVIGFIIIAVLCAFVYHEMYEHKKKDDESKKRLDRLNTNTVRALAYTIDAKDRYTSGHSQRVANYSLELAKRMGKSKEEQQIIYHAGLLHDVGKIRVPEEVINKPGKLNEDEFNQIKMHPVSGYHILKDIYDDKRIATGAKYHHERYDGTGYPNGLSGSNIPEIARIIGVADAYDAMASNRSYRSALPQEAVRSEIYNGRGKQFDPEIADIMLTMIDEDKEYKMCQLDSVQKNILVVDDEMMNIRMVEHILKSEENYNILSAVNSTDAMEILKNNKIDLILLDVLMPDINGFELYKEIRKLYSVPVVIMTADKSIEVAEKTIELGIDDYITKPFIPVILREMVHGIINSWK